MNSSTNKLVMAFNGSPVRGGNIDIITKNILKGAGEAGFSTGHSYLNNMQILPCQSCGESPGRKLCFFEDDLFPFLQKFAECDIAVVSSPVYFDSVSAQTKLFIDRCNCFKPLNGYHTGKFRFRQLKLKPRLGIIVLVGGDREKFIHALTVVKGFFIWTGVTLFDQIIYAHADYEIGGVAGDVEFLEKARQTGFNAARKVGKK
jgi:multimeric flavodoxin WrbA